MINMNSCYVYNEETDETVFVERSDEDIADMAKMFDDMLWLGRHLAIKDTTISEYLNSGEEMKVEIAKKALEAEEKIIEKYKNEELFIDFMTGEKSWYELLGVVETFRWIFGDEWGTLDS